MSAPVTIRRAADADEAALGRLGEMLVAVHHGFDPKRFIAPGPGTRKGYGAFLRGEAKREDAFVLVAEVDGAVAGYLYAASEGRDWMSLRGPAGVIYDIVVDPDRRRGGVGRKLVERALIEFEKIGATQVVLSTATRNADAQKLFAGAGFRPTMIEMTRDQEAGG